MAGLVWISIQKSERPSGAYPNSQNLSGLQEQLSRKISGTCCFWSAQKYLENVPLAVFQHPSFWKKPGAKVPAKGKSDEKKKVNFLEPRKAWFETGDEEEAGFLNYLDWLVHP